MGSKVSGERKKEELDTGKEIQGLLKGIFCPVSSYFMGSFSAPHSSTGHALRVSAANR